MPAKKQHRCLAVGRSELQPASCCHVGRLDLSDYAGKRSVTQRVLSHGEDFGILAALGVEQFLGAKTHLFETGRVEIEGSDCPKDAEARLIAKTRSDSRQEKRSGRVVVQTCRAGSNLMDPASVQSMVGKPVINLRDAEA